MLNFYFHYVQINYILSNMLSMDQINHIRQFIITNILKGKITLSSVDLIINTLCNAFIVRMPCSCRWGQKALGFRLGQYRQINGCDDFFHVLFFWTAGSGSMGEARSRNKIQESGAAGDRRSFRFYSERFGLKMRGRARDNKILS